MRLATVKADGATRFGAVAGGGFIDLSARMRGRCEDVAGLFAANLVAEAAALASSVKPDLALDGLTFLPPNSRRDARMFALGVSYKDHQLETGSSDAEFPSLFSKHPQALVGHGQPLVRPRISDKFDYEGEIVVVIGKPGRHMPGDAISTGTPAGVGHRRNPPVFMKAGDVIEVEASGIGTLRNTVIDE